MNQIILKHENRTCALGDLYGIFFEDINHAADGGLYAQMVRNYAFEFCSIDNKDYRALTAWEPLGTDDAKMSLAVRNRGGFSKENPHYLTVEIEETEMPAGFMNVGYNSGMYFEQNKVYLFSCYARNESEQPVRYMVSLIGADGAVYAEKELIIESAQWKKYALELIAADTATSGRIALTTTCCSQVSFDFISLFPKDTFHDRTNGLRKDIAQMLAELKPKFMRFPGGCLIHDGSLNGDDRDSLYRWKNTIGNVEDRPARRNNWNYNQTLGLGYYEYFLLCEDIGAKPVPILPAGYNPHSGQGVPKKYLKEWIDDALDLIEFANGGPDTKWGKKRAELGHPEPFGLEYIGIGNEEVGEGFFERYPLFHKAIKEKYPGMKIINSAGPFSAGRDFERGWKSAEDNHSDLVDEHYYTSPEWMLANVHRYDNYDVDKPHVFIGEYASWGNTYYNALCEAAYMTGIEKNADKVGLACYAPLLCNVDYENWAPDMIWFDNYRVFGSANYYVQKLFMNHQGTHGIELDCKGFSKRTVINDNPVTGSISLKALGCTAEYSKISIVDNSKGTVSDFDDVLLQSGGEYALGSINSEDYTIFFTAKRMNGNQGFCMAFGQKNAENLYEWSLSGRGGGITEIISYSNRRGTSLSQDRFRLLDSVEYECRLDVKGRFIKGEIKNCAVMEAYDKELITEELYCAASVDVESGEVILKAVNVQMDGTTAQICVDGAKSAVIYEMSGYALEAVNTFDNPRTVIPKERRADMDDGRLTYTFKPQSVTVFRFLR